MATDQEIQDSLKVPMRAAELQRRQARHQIILNHAALAEEKLTPEEVQINAAAIKQIAQSMARQEHDLQEAYRYEYKALHKGYFATLLDALLGRI